MAQVSVRGWIAALSIGLLAMVAVAGCTPDGEVPAAQEPSPTGAAPAHLSVVVYGPKPVTRAWRTSIDTYTRSHPEVTVDVAAYPDEAAALTAVRADAADQRAPDLFLAGLESLPALMQDQLIQPVDELLGARQVDFGDGYARGAVEEFSHDAALQCMPVAYSPLVVYYNPALVDLSAAQGTMATPIAMSGTWTMEQFSTAARLASRNGRHGLYVAPTADQVAPFLASAGGGVVDDPDNPTTLTLSSSGSVTGLTQLLALVRDPRVSLPSSTPQARAVRDFETGQLAMMLGYRDLTGVLRAHAKVRFNVLPMPTIGGAATSGQTTGMCMSRTSSNPAAADLLTDLVAQPAMKALARTGYVMPSSLAVLASNAFVQPAKMPASANVFTDQVRNIVDPIVTLSGPRLVAYVDGRLRALLGSGSATPDAAVLTARLQLFDAVSQQMLAPPSPSATPSGSPGATPSAD